MFLNFLTRPQSSDEQMAVTNSAFESGVRAGSDGASEYFQQQADLQKAGIQKEAQVTVEQEKSKTDLLKKQIDSASKTNDETYKDVSSALSGKIDEQQKALDSQTYDNAGQQTLRDNIAHNRALLDRLQQARQQNLELPPGTIHRYGEEYTNAPSLPSNLAVSQSAGEATLGERGSKYYSYLKQRRDYEEPGWDKKNSAGDGEKVPAKAADARDEFAAGVATLPVQAQRVVDASRAVKKNPGDNALATQYNGEVQTLQRAHDGVQKAYATMIGRLTEGDYGPGYQSTFNEVARSLPGGTDPSNVNNHSLISQAINNVLVPLAEKKRKSGLTPAEEVIAARYAKLASLIYADKDVAGAIKAATFSQDTPEQQGTSMQNLKGTPPTPMPAAVDSVAVRKYGQTFKR